MFIAHLATRYARVYPVQVVKIMTTTEMRVSRKNKSVFLSLEEEENILLQKKFYGCDLSLYLLCNQSYLLQQLCNQFSLLFYVENCDAKNDVKIKVLKTEEKNMSLEFSRKRN